LEIPDKYRMVGQSAAFMQCWRIIQKFACHDTTVLICGETGTGKELVARALHYLSARANGPFVPVNCGAIPDSLLESEFFGHEKGAFTDAQDPQTGLVAQAFGGTLLLDEVETLSPRGQTVLLRFLQDYHYRTVGGRKELVANVRVVAATNRELAILVEQGVFRQDLMYRLNSLVINVPPLRTRTSDIALIAKSLLQHWEGATIPSKRLSAGASKLLQIHSWPGNIRELENVLLNAFLMAEGDEITEQQLSNLSKIESLEAADRSFQPFRVAKQAAINSFERAYLEHLMNNAGGNITKAAHISHQHRTALSKLLKKYDISPPL
jgi:DNA-binding NtrC family response regulator